tara:strand:+ start:1105 stop:1938 length:834 start_codon:yes stop_codon:yes gene_type:complete
MPLQKRKKKKKAPPKKTGGMSQVQNVKVVVNAGPAARRRRRAPAKKKDAPFSFGGGGGGGGAGLAQVTYAPSLTQDVLQQSQELRQTIQKIQVGHRPGSNTITGEPGQPENPLAPDQLPVTRQQLKFVMGSVIEQQSLQNQAMTQGFEQYKALAGSQLQALDDSLFSLTTSKAEAPPVARSQSRESLVQSRSPSPDPSPASGGGGAAESSPPPSTVKRGRGPNVPQEVRDRVYRAWSENRQLPKGLQKSLEELAREEGMALNTFNGIRQGESRKRAT